LDRLPAEEPLVHRLTVAALFFSMLAFAGASEARQRDPVMAVECGLTSTVDAAGKSLINQLINSVTDVKAPADLTVDYPLNASIFPPEIIAPTFLWHDSSGDASHWLVEVTFEESPARIYVLAPGLPPPEGEIDPLAISGTNEVYKLTPYQASAKSFKPAPDVWAAVKHLSVDRTATVNFYGYRGPESQKIVSRGQTTLRTSSDPVGAPIFYRDVPLSPTTTKKDIMPLPKGALPLIKWRLRDISLPASRVMLHDMPTCANCHSFSADGSTMGMDIDGRQGDKGAYALAPIDNPMVIEDDEIITWNSFTEKPKDHKTLGFLSRVSPSGRYVTSTLNEAIYVRNFRDYKFGQVFYPTRGILAYYDRETGVMRSLPGADNPEFVHNGGVWTPDGKYLVFARAGAKDPFPEDRPLAQYAGDPNELPMRYDLHRIPFNEGRGGQSEPITGASANGMSNTFPKVSPDGKWIVFVKSKNGMLMRPDSTLWIVPAAGGEARRMRCNTRLMNSWHSFSPNGRWLVFSTKSNTPYTQMMLTHIDENGNDSPAILIENSTAANRAVNLPEFVNVDYDDFQPINVPVVEFYRHYHRGNTLAIEGRDEEAIKEFELALKDSDESRIRDALARSLIRSGQPDKAMKQIKESLKLNPYNFETHLNMGYLLTQKGELEKALEHLNWAVKIHPRHQQGWFNRATLLLNMGRTELALADYSEALRLEPRYPEALNGRGIVLRQLGDLAGAEADFDASIAMNPNQAKPLYFRGLVKSERGDLPAALEDVNSSLALTPQESPRRAEMEALAQQIRAELGN
jgi:tetratricopeptide (TPR) repeat protein